MMRAAGFAPRLVSADDRRHRRAAFRLALVIVRARRASRSRASAAPASCSPARACFGAASIRRDACRRAARHSRRCALARLIERPSSGAAEMRLVDGAHAARAELRQARPVPGDAAGRRRRRARARSRTAAGPDAAVPASARRRPRSPPRSAGRSHAVFATLRPAGRGRLDRAGASRRGRDGDGAARRRGQGAAARRRAALPRRSRAPSPSPRATPKSFPPRRGGCGSIEVVDTLAPLGHGRDGFPPGGGGALGNGREHQGRSGFPRAGGRLGPHRQGSADAGMDRRHAAVRPRAAATPRASTCRSSRAR